MRPPNESLEDFTVPDRAANRTQPPTVRSVRLSGELEVLKPIARPTALVKRNVVPIGALERRIPTAAARRLSWYHRSVAFTIGLAAIALVVGIIAGFYAPTEPGGSSELVMDRQPAEVPAFANGPDGSGSLRAALTPPAVDGPSAARSIVKRKAPITRALRASYRPPMPKRLPHLVVSSFVPTTLIIYIENGVVRTRVEPWLTDSKKRESMPSE